MTITQTSIVRDMDEAEYHADPVAGGSLSQSRAKVLLRPGGPARFKWAEDHKQERRQEFEFGKAAHSLVLGVGAPIVTSPYDSFRKKDAQKWRDEQQEAGAIVLSAEDAAKVAAMAEQIKLHPLAMQLLENTEREVSMFAQDPETGVWLRGRCDAGDGVGVIDYKTAASADPEQFDGAALKFGYHVQRAWYGALSKLTGSGFGERFRFIVQEKTAPFLVSVIEMDSLFEQKGHDDMRRALELYVECSASGVWPGYDPGITYISPPAWAFDDIDLEIGA